jgi:hypothetical protein
VDGILGHNLLLSRAFLHNLFFFYGGILAIRKPFSRTFLFSRWNSGYQEAFFTNSSFFTMEFWLSGSLSHELSSFFKMEFLLSGSLSHELSSFFKMEFWLSGSLFHKLFHDRILEIRDLGEDSLYI